jgi:diguanylate cyclase (GGDEF)-like protein
MPYFEPLHQEKILVAAREPRQQSPAMILDSLTLLINSAFISFVMAIAMLMTWRINRSQLSALFWALAALMNGLGLSFYALTAGFWPAALAPLANIPIALAGLAMWIGLRSFRQVRWRVALGFVPIVFYLGGIAYFLLVQPNTNTRILIACGFQAVTGFAFMREALLVQRRGLAGAAAGAVAFIFFGHALYYVVRGTAALGLETITDFMAPSQWQTYTFLESGIGVLCMGVALMAMTVDHLYQQLRLTALQDRTTGLLSRNAVLERLSQAIPKAHADGKPLHLMMLDLDHLDRINETYGHGAGDAMLAAFGAMLRANFAVAENSGRYGGDEFAVILPNVTTSEATSLAHQLRRATESLIIPLENGRVSLTISIGLTGLQTQDSQVDSLIARAYSALYRAKQGGRNRVVVL